MRRSPLGRVVEHILAVASGRDAEGVADGDLLERFIRRKDEAAFETLMRRHGSMVLGVCRRVLGNAADAEDAFQAVFLVLVRKASSIRPRDKVGAWLHGVARRTALEGRRLAARRRTKEAESAPRAEKSEDRWTELLPLLDEEIARLPHKHRAVLILCDLEGKGRKEAAEQLGVPEGTAASRLARARAALAKRLARRGLAVTCGGLAAVLSQNGASPDVPAALANTTRKAATAVAAGHAALGGVISTQVAALTEGVVKTMLLTKLKIAAALLALLGVASLTYVVLEGGQPNGKSEAGKPAIRADDRPKAPEQPKTGDGAPKSDDFITDVGEHKLFDGKVVVNVSEPEDGKLRWEIAFQVGPDKHSERLDAPLMKKGSPWFVYPESPGAVWIFNGDDRIHFLGIADVMGQKNVPVGFDDTLPSGWSMLLDKKAPKEVLDRLPAALHPKEEPKK